SKRSAPTSRASRSRKSGSLTTSIRYTDRIRTPREPTSTRTATSNKGDADAHHHDVGRTAEAYETRRSAAPPPMALARIAGSSAPARWHHLGRESGLAHEPRSGIAEGTCQGQ